MKHKRRIWAPLILVFLMLIAKWVYAQPEGNADKTLSPYFFVKSDDPEVDRLPLKSTSVKVNIAGVIADVIVTQVYKNEGKKPLEAIYIFPASTRAAVYGMKMTIGERIITAKIRKREKARQEYEQAMKAGQSASLLEQQRPNVFQMSVANILPSDVITVALRYTELLVPTDAVYEFVYPTVVGPRYSNQLAIAAHPSEKWIENPYLYQGKHPTYTFDMTVNLAAGLPIQRAFSSSHKININYEGPSFASIRLDRSERYGGNRDFILEYQLAGSKIDTGLLLFEGEKENFFLLMLQPPKRVTDRQIPPREYIFIVDVSGSMHGFPLNISKKLLKDLIGKLHPTDRFNVLLFAGGSSVMSKQSLPANPKNIRNAINLIERQRGGGGTELLPALKKALSQPGAEGYSRSVVIATDGYVSVEKEAFDLIRNNLGSANMFTFGIGASVNRYIIEGMARVGMGEPFIITRPEEAKEKAENFRKLILSPVLTGIKADFGKFMAYDVEPPSIPDLLAERPVIMFGKWRGKHRGNITIAGITGNRPFIKKIAVSKARPSMSNTALRYLWARHRIAALSDYNRLRPNDERTAEITSLGLTYNLLTAYTSFIAVDTNIRLKDGKSVTAKQPLPLPHGVSDYAVGGRVLKQKATSYLSPSSPMIGRNVRVNEESLKDKKSGLGYKKIHIELGKITVTEGLSRETVQILLTKHISSIRLCCKQALEKRSALKGEMIFRVVIDQGGRIIKVHMGKGKKKNKELEQCIIQNLKKLSFPAPQEGKKAMITIAFILK